MTQLSRRHIKSMDSEEAKDRILQAPLRPQTQEEVENKPEQLKFNQLQLRLCTAGFNC